MARSARRVGRREAHATAVTSETALGSHSDAVPLSTALLVAFGRTPESLRRLRDSITVDLSRGFSTSLSHFVERTARNQFSIEQA